MTGASSSVRRGGQILSSFDMAGRQPPGLTLKKLLELRLPLLWSDQVRVFDPPART